jgi:phage FluMu protein Com
MSFIKAHGEQAVQQAITEKPKYEKLLKTFKSGSTYKVRIASSNDSAQYDAHGVFARNGSGILTTPCIHGKECPYCKAVNEMYKEFNVTQDEETKQVAGQLKAKERYLMGFVNLEDGQPFILDFTKKQAAQLVGIIKKNEKKLSKYAFEISKSGTSQSTIVSLDIVVDMDEDLTDNERKHFEATKEFKFVPEMFEVLQTKTIEESIDDLRKFGFDVSKITSTPPPKQPPQEQAKEQTKEEPSDDGEIDIQDIFEQFNQ